LIKNYHLIEAINKLVRKEKTLAAKTKVETKEHEENK
jgi:hypothetical protein